MKRTQTTDLESIRKAYKKARSACKHGDKSNKDRNEELTRVKTEAKKALDEAEAAAAEATPCSDDAKVVESAETLPKPDIIAEDSGEDGTSEKKDKDDGIDNAKVVDSVETSPKEAIPEDSGESGTNENKDDDTNADSAKIKLLEEAYQKALSAFKANKTDKDLRRAKTAARRTLDEAIAASADGKQLACVHCSKKFIFSNEEQQKFDEMGWKELPKRCEACKEERTGRTAGARVKLDSKKKNMCYAFQRGECPHGEHCKFSHNPECGGKRSTNDSEEGNEVKNDDTPKVKESNERKERGLKKGKGKRNK